MLDFIFGSAITLVAGIVIFFIKTNRATHSVIFAQMREDKENIEKKIDDEIKEVDISNIRERLAAIETELRVKSNNRRNNNG